MAYQPTSIRPRQANKATRLGDTLLWIVLILLGVVIVISVISLFRFWDLPSVVIDIGGGNNGGGGGVGGGVGLIGGIARNLTLQLNRLQNTVNGLQADLDNLELSLNLKLDDLLNDDDDDNTGNGNAIGNATQSCNRSLVVNASIRQEYDTLVAYDNIRQPIANALDRTNITYFPAVPLPPPQGSGAGVTLPTFDNNTFDLNRFKQLNAVPTTLNYFFGFNALTSTSSNPRIPVFDTNVEDRGPNNEGQRIVMNAVTREKVLCLYSEQTETFLGEVLIDWILSRPVLSSFRENLVNYYLNIHLGERNHPAYVEEYFTSYLTYIANLPTESDEEAAQRTIRARLLYECVRAYFVERIQEAVSQRKVDTIVYHWVTSTPGLSVERAATEAIRNFVQFGPLLNAVALIVNQTLNPAITPGTCGVSFIELYRQADLGNGIAFLPNCTRISYPGTASQLKLNVVREFFRIMLPYNLFVSRDTQPVCTGTCAVNTQARHIPQLIQIRAEYNRADLTDAYSPANALGFVRASQLYAFYNPTRYVANFSASLEDEEFNCTASPTSNDVNAFTTSPVDRLTLLPPGDERVIPVFAQPIYAGFGLGATRNPMEILLTHVVYELFNVMTVFEFTNCVVTPLPRNQTCPTEIIPLAPLRSARDSLFATIPV